MFYFTRLDFIRSRAERVHPFTNSSLLPPLSSPWQQLFDSVSVVWLPKKIPHVRDICSICLFLSGLFPLAQCPQDPSMLAEMTGGFPSFPWLNTLCVCVRVCTPSLPIYSSADEHLGCFRVLSIVSNAAVNVGMQICLQYRVLLPCGHIPNVGLLDHILVPFFIF